MLENLEEKISQLLAKYQELVDERNELLSALKEEKERRLEIEKKMELLSHDREQVKIKIDQLLQRLKGLDL
ncbi:MAG: hypothetical protein ACUVTN_10795 [Thermodesulfobacteriota bacterium]